ncbi:MAG: hypothetical protein JST90_11165 [Bacteroidetes bacterium]|nr:hypothetical protein [Bacteroidota bacterium]
MTAEEKEEILHSYKWIKVKSFKEEEGLTWEEKYRALEKHHSAETNFLIAKVRELVLQIPVENK